MPRQYKADMLITVYSLDHKHEVKTYKTLTSFCNDYQLSENEGRRLVTNCAGFLNSDCTESFVAYQGEYDIRCTQNYYVRQMTRIFGDADAEDNNEKIWEVFKITENPYPEDSGNNTSLYTLSNRQITITASHINIYNYKHLTSIYSLKDIIFKTSHIHGTGEVQIYNKTNLLGLYSSQSVAEKKVVVDQRLSSYTPIVAMPMFADEEQIIFESINQAAQFFEVHKTTIKNKIKTGTFIDKDKKFFTLKFLGE